MRDPYRALGVQRNADADTVKKAFKKLARQYHPDLNTSPTAAERFKEISTAYDIVGDEKKRALWDEFGEASTRPGFDEAKAKAWKAASGPFGRRGGGRPGAAGWSEIFGEGVGGFEDLFGFGGGGRSRAGPAGGRSRRARGARGIDFEGVIEIDFVESVRGVERDVEFTRGGQTERLRIQVPPGVENDQTIRLRGKGAAGVGGGPAGDFLVRVSVRTHPFLRRDGADLSMDVPITFGEALAGAQIEVPTPDGPLKVRVPAGSGNGRRLRIKGRGVPTSERRGDLYLVLRPTAPPDGGPERLAAEIDGLYKADVRADLKL